MFYVDINMNVQAFVLGVCDYIMYFAVFASQML
jgi:hypothetical protein